MSNSILSLRAYCEPMLSSGMEPLNAISNLGFILVALYIIRRHRTIELLPVGVLTLLLGLGSFAWHTFRSIPTYYADTAPLAFLLLLVTYLIFKRYHAYAPIVGFLVIGIIYSILEYHFVLADPGCSEIYFSIILTLLGLVVLQWIAKKQRTTQLFTVFILFSVGYGIRQLDQVLCNSPIFSYGTHWIWHLICAGAIYYAIQYLKK
ncbi:MAG: ceramidase domain-containing protein [Candidatus Peribacteraceae bacterium]